MSYIPEIEIDINGNVARRAHSIHIERSADELGAKCIIKVPTTAHLDNTERTQVEVAQFFAVGDTVSVKLGYNGVVGLEYEGYIKRINETTPLEIECEDDVYLLRKISINKGFPATTLAEILDFIIADTDIKIEGVVPDITFESYVIKNRNAASALQKLKDEYGLTMYFLGRGRLFVGFGENQSRTVVKYVVGENIITPDLKSRLTDDVQIKVKAIHIQRDNSRTIVEVGDDDGELRTFYDYSVKSKAELKRLAQEQVELLKTGSLDSSLTTFLLPLVIPGQVAKIEDRIYPARSGNYRVDKVTTTLDDNGGRRKVELGIKQKDE